MHVSVIALLIIVIVLALLALNGKLRAIRAEREYPPVGDFIEVEGAMLHFVRKGSGPTVLLLHGSDGFLQDFPAELVDILADQFDVVALDRPGHGYSDGPVGESALPVTQVRLILGLLRQLGVESAIWVAHSWGALPAMITAVTQPDAVSGLVLLAPWIYPPRSGPPLTLTIFRIPVIGSAVAACIVPLIKRSLIRSTIRRAFSPDPAPPAFVERAACLWLRGPRQIRVFALESTFDRQDLRRFSPEYPNIRVPITVIVGDEDNIVPSCEHTDRLRAARPATEVTVLPHTGHEIPQSRPDAVAKAVYACYARTKHGKSSAHITSVHATIDHARKLVFRYGWNATSYQILNPNMELWFTANGDGLVGFVRRYGFRVVAGAPVCDEEKLAELVVEFENSARNLGERVCYFGAAARLQAALRVDPGHSEIEIGAQPVWDPAGWPNIIARTSSLRSQLNRAKNKGVSVSEWSKDRSEQSGALMDCLREWLDARPLPTLHFLTEPVDLDDIQDRRMFVAETAEGVIGYLAAAPVPDRNGWLIEQIVRGNTAPNGVAELLVDAAMRSLVDGGFTYVTLGLSPLSSRVEAEDAGRIGGGIGPSLLLKWVRAHGRRFYNFDGLDTFKAKFRPDAWEPITVISNERRISLQALHAVAAAFSSGPPVRTILKAMIQAARQEVAWLIKGKSGGG